MRFVQHTHMRSRETFSLKFLAVTVPNRKKKLYVFRNKLDRQDPNRIAQCTVHSARRALSNENLDENWARHEYLPRIPIRRLVQAT
jgi:hypothetical protein